MPNSDLVLKLYADDDVTVAQEFGTAAAHARPYLHVPTEYASAEIDLKEGTARIGRLNIRIVDPQTGATQAERFVTNVLGDPAGYSKINGRRARLERATGELVQDGICAGATLSDTFAGFEFALEDFRARGIDLRAHDSPGTATVLPRGVLNGFGWLKPGTLRFIPATKPLAATYSVIGANAFVEFPDIGWDDRLSNADRVVTAKMEAVTQPAAVEGGRLVYRDAAILWRPAAGGAWTQLDDLDAFLGEDVGMIRTQRAKVLQNEKLVDVRAADYLLAGLHADGQTRPLNGAAIEVIVVYTGPASDDYPFHFDGTWGEYVRNLLRGDYSASDPRIPYDEPALLAYDTPVLIRLTEPVEDLREHLQDMHRALAAAPALDAQGEVSPVRARLPAPSVTLPVLDDSNCQPLPGWEHPISDAVTVVELTYPRYRQVRAADDPEGARSGGDGLAQAEQTIRVEPLQASILTVMGEQVHEVDAFCFGALAGVLGDPLSGDVDDETGFQIAYGIGHELIDRLTYGGQSSFLKADAADPAVATRRVGDWVIDRRSWAPNYAIGRRGRDHVAQIVAIKDLNPAWREIRLLDAAPYANPLTAPTLGAVTADGDGVISVPISALPAGAEARVDYAVSATEPAEGSGLWTFLGRTAAVGTLKSPPMASGVTVWVRGRSEAVGRRPSVWTARQSVTTASTPRLRSMALTIDEAGVATVTWEANAHAPGLLLYFQEHDPDVAPAPVSSVDVDASLGSYVLPITVALEKALTVDGEPWSDWTGTAVSGSPGAKVRRTAIRGRETLDVAAPAAVIEQLNRAIVTETLRFSGSLGAGGVGPLEWRYGTDTPGVGTQYGVWQATALPQDVVITRDDRLVTVVHLQVRDADGLIGHTSHPVDPVLEGLGVTGAVDDQQPMEGGQLPFRRFLDEASDVVEDLGRGFIHPDSVTTSRYVHTAFRNTLLEPTSAFFKRGSDPASDVVETATLGFFDPTYGSSRRPNALLRSTLKEASEALFKRGADPASDVVETASLGFFHPDYSDASRRPDAMHRGALVPANDWLAKTLDTADALSDGASRRVTTHAEADQATSPTQNLLGPDAGPEITVLDDVVFYLIASTSSLGLEQGNIISAGIDARSDLGSGQSELHLQARTADGNTTLQTWTASQTSTGYVRLRIEAAQLPVNTGQVRVFVHRSARGTGDAFRFRRAMLNWGPVALPFEEPPLRPARTGPEADAYIGGGRAKETLVASRQLHPATVVETQNVARGLKKGSQVDSGSVVFSAPAFPTTPHVWFGPGGLSYHTGLSSASHGPVVEALNLDASGFQLRAILRQAVGAITARSVAFSGDTATKNTTPEAWDDKYTFLFDVTVQAGVVTAPSEPRDPSSITLYFYTNDGSGEVLRATRMYSNDGISSVTYLDEEVEVTVNLMGLNSTFRIVVAVTEGDGGSVARANVSWGEATAPAEASMGTAAIPFTAGLGT